MYLQITAHNWCHLFGSNNFGEKFYVPVSFLESSSFAVLTFLENLFFLCHVYFRDLTFNKQTPIQTSLKLNWASLHKYRQ